MMVNPSPRCRIWLLTYYVIKPQCRHITPLLYHAFFVKQMLIGTIQIVDLRVVFVYGNKILFENIIVLILHM